MKKFSTSAFVLAMALTLPMGFASCSSSSDSSNTVTPDTEKKDSTKTDTSIPTATELSTVANTYVNDIIYKTYADLRTNAGTLKTACETAYAHIQAGTLTDADMEACAEAFKDARREWERSEAFLYGAAENNEIDPHIDSWPLDKNQLVSALNDATLLEGLHGSNPAQFINSKNGDFQSVIGFHGLEFVIFRDGAVRTAEMLKKNDTFEGMTSVKGVDELAFAAAVSGDLYNMISLLQYGWNGDATLGSWITTNCNWVIEGLKKAEESSGALSSAGIGYGLFLLNTTGEKAWFPTWQEAFENALVAGCSNICDEVQSQKLGQAYRKATGTGTEDDAADYIESPYSKRSFIDYQDNIYSIKNSLYGTRDITVTEPTTNSMMYIMKKYNYSGYTDLETALSDAIGTLERAKNSGTAFIDDPGNAQVGNCINMIKNLDDELNKAGKWFRALKVSNK